MLSVVQQISTVVHLRIAVVQAQTHVEEVSQVVQVTVVAIHVLQVRKLILTKEGVIHVIFLVIILLLVDSA
jgi:hypothetical protein